MVTIKRSEIEKMKREIVDEETEMSRFDQFEFEHSHEDWNIIDDLTPRNPAETEKEGKIAMELITEYPLYASSSNISYEEAIAIAKILFGDDLEQALSDMNAEDEWFAKMQGEEKITDKTDEEREIEYILAKERAGMALDKYERLVLLNRGK